MKIFVNEREVEVDERTLLSDIVNSQKPGADVLVRNGALAQSNDGVTAGDRIVLIKRGEVPSAEELDVLMAARHTPGIHQRLKTKTVGIAGCGGLGSTVAIALARVGVGRLILVDFDVVEPSNLNRQQYFIDQIGQPKVHALKANLARINPSVKVECHLQKLDKGNLGTIFKDCDVLVEAFDRADQKGMLCEGVAQAFPLKPLVLGIGMAGYGGNDLLKTKKSSSWYICGDGLAEARSSFGLMAPRVGVVAHLQANQVMEILLGPDPNLIDASRSTPGEEERR